MIELCSRRRMIICIIALVCLSIFVVILEAIFTPDTVHHATSLPPTDLNATTARPRCWHTEPFKVTTPCRPCTVLEKASGSIPECTRSTPIEQLLCEQFGRVFRGLSIFVVILEAIFTPDTVHHATSLPPTDLNATTARPRCWHTEPFKVTTPCRPCTVLEKASGSIPECTRSTHVEQLLCEQFGRVFRGCDQAGQIARVRFLYFEGWMLVGSVASGVVVLLRQRHLERTALRRIQLQIAAGV